MGVCGHHITYILGVKSDAVVMVMALTWGDLKLMN